MSVVEIFPPEYCKVFDDVFAIDGVDEYDDEERFYTIGMAEGRLLFVAYTLRNGTIRIISARAAETP